MGCNKCKTKGKCGCEDKGLTTNSPCAQDTQSCPTGDPCPETFSAACVAYTGDELPELGITQGERLDTILQKLILALTNPGCAYPGNSCLSVIGLASTAVTSTTAKFKWLASSTATSYSVEYRTTTSGTWLINPSTTLLTDTISGLTANTEYYVRVNTTCSSGNCYSLTIKIKTKTI